jgi:hypothetical protein
MKEYVVCDLKVDKSSSLLSQSSEFAPLYVPVSLMIVISNTFLSLLLNLKAISNETNNNVVVVVVVVVVV